MAQTRAPRRNGWLGLGILLIAAPLLLSILWGTAFSDAAYLVLQAARELGGELLPRAGSPLLAQTPLVLAALATGGRFAPQVALVLGALGWGAAGIVVLLALRAAGRPLAAVFAAVLLVVNPLVLTTAGTHSAWIVALGWAALALTVLPIPAPVWLKTLLVILLLAIDFEPATILFALALPAIDVYKGRGGWLSFALVAAAVFLWGAFIIPRGGGFATADARMWLSSAYDSLLREQLSWLFLPFVAAGLWDVWTWQRGETSQAKAQEGQQFMALLLLWPLVGVATGGTQARFVLAAAVVVLAGLGAAWLARSGERGARSGERGAALLLPLLILAPLLLVSLAGVRQLYRARPLAQAALQDQAAAWLRENSAAGATLYAPPRTGYLAGRDTAPALLEEMDAGRIDNVYAQLLAAVPDYVVAENALAWDYVTRTRWFQERYEEQARFENGYAAQSPLVIWAYTPSAFDEGQREEITAVVDDRFALVGSRFEPQVLVPGQDIYLTLYLEALQPVAHGFISGVHLAAPDGWVWAWREERTPRSLSGELWQVGQVIPERIRLLTTDDVPTGAYDLQVFWRAADEKNNWPIVRESDGAVMDRLSLGYVTVPPDVDTAGATAVDAQFGEGIRLGSYEMGAPQRGEPWTVTLFWEALSTPAADYTVFVHLLDGDGQLVAAHDGMPAGGLFPTAAWPAGVTIADSHQLALPQDLAPGSYQVKVGLYLLETGERLAARDSAGVEQAERSLPLATVEILP